ncbi:MFS transporter [Billgrantia bachuensis]|uniref:MFS transporter n=1 Tax=Billgrantia bachuensis TaxID=2717286 RepID=A0ABX0PWQ3_9GAMM|nr:MFS transporter [Halomonas bachuensis]NIC06598.1 MFS transporter [Halomonas bachuensis]
MGLSSSPKDGKSPSEADFVFRVLAAVQATLIFTIALIMVPLPRLGLEFLLGPAELLLLQVAYGLSFSGLLLFGGRLSDRFGGQRIFYFGLTVFGSASLGAALAPSFEFLVSVRFAQGVGAAFAAPAAMSLLRGLFPEPAAYGKAMAVWGGVSVLGALLGFIASGIVTTWLSWRWMFSVPVLVAVAAFVLTRGRLPKERRKIEYLGLDPLGAILATLGVALTSYGLIASGNYAWASVRVFGPLMVGIALLVGFLMVERRVRHPLLPSGFIREPCRIAGLVGMLLAAAGSVLIEFVLTLYLQQVRDWSTLQVALAFLPFAITLVAANHIAVSLVERCGAAGVSCGGFVIAGIGLAVLTAIAHDTAYVSVLLPGQVLLAAGISMVFSGSAVLSTINVPQEQAGLAGGVMNTAMELGPTVGLAVLMSVAATQTDTIAGYSWAFGAAALAYGLIAFLTLGLSRRKVCSAAAKAMT